MKSKNVILIILGISLVTISMFSYVTLMQNRYIQELKNNIEIDKSRYKYFLNNLVKSEIAQFQMTAKKFKGNYDLIKNLKTSFKSSQKFVFRFDEFSCETCIENALLDLKEYGDKIGINNILIMCSYSNEKDFENFKYKIHSRYNFININQENSLFLDEKYKNLPPHFFVIDSELQPSFFYFYTKEIPDLNKGYFELINNYFNSL